MTTYGEVIMIDNITLEEQAVKLMFQNLTNEISFPKLLLDDPEISKPHILFFLFIREHPFSTYCEISKHFDRQIRGCQKLSSVLKSKGYIQHDKLDDYHWIWKINI